ncbi:MAG: hypothetical protein FJ087_11070 [Deltaproteobacteria bacterium]|nr:hypothetical protein [Deltaproteobacteria bacterium]
MSGKARRGGAFWVGVGAVVAAAAVAIWWLERCPYVTILLVVPLAGWRIERARAGAVKWLRRAGGAVAAGLAVLAVADAALETAGAPRVGEMVHRGIPDEARGEGDGRGCPSTRNPPGDGRDEHGWIRHEAQGPGARPFTVAIVTDDVFSRHPGERLVRAFEAGGIRAQVRDLGGGGYDQRDQACAYGELAAEVRPDLVVHTFTPADFVPVILRMKLGARHRDYMVGAPLHEHSANRHALPLLLEPGTAWVEANEERIASAGDEAPVGFDDEAAFASAIASAPERAAGLDALARSAERYRRDGVPAVFVALPFNYRTGIGPWRTAGKGFADALLDEAVAALDRAGAVTLDARDLLYRFGSDQLRSEPSAQAGWDIHNYTTWTTSTVLYLVMGVVYERFHIEEAVIARGVLARDHMLDIEPWEREDLLVVHRP